MGGALAAWHFVFLVSFLPFLRPVLPTRTVASFARTHIMACDSKPSGKQAGSHVCLELDASLAFAFPSRQQHVRAPPETSLGPYDPHVAQSLPTGKRGSGSPIWKTERTRGVPAWIRRSPGQVWRGSGVREGGRFPFAWVLVVGSSPLGSFFFRFFLLPLSIGRDPVPSGSSSFRFPIERDLDG